MQWLRVVFGIANYLIRFCSSRVYSWALIKAAVLCIIRSKVNVIHYHFHILFAILWLKFYGISSLEERGHGSINLMFELVYVFIYTARDCHDGLAVHISIHLLKHLIE
jgi:hypothetical protein